jgi:hypothetical protein
MQFVRKSVLNQRHLEFPKYAADPGEMAPKLHHDISRDRYMREPNDTCRFVDCSFDVAKSVVD